MFKLLVLAFFVAAASAQVWNPSSDPEWREGVPDSRCPAPNGNRPTFFAHPADCTWYYQCNDGTAFPMPCSPGLHWNIVETACDHPELAGCINRRRPF